MGFLTVTFEERFLEKRFHRLDSLLLVPVQAKDSEGEYGGGAVYYIGSVSAKNWGYVRLRTAAESFVDGVYCGGRLDRDCKQPEKAEFNEEGTSTTADYTLVAHNLE